METLGYLGIDQYGNRFDLKKYPRKELIDQLDASSAQKMYVDTKDGKSKHTGYIIKGHWVRVLTVSDWGEVKV